MEIPEIKASLSIQRVLVHYGLLPDRNDMLHCPFHHDKTPSMKIYPETNTFCCFSSNCSAGTGDVISFIQLKEESSKREAILKAKTIINPSYKKMNAQLPQEITKKGIYMRFWQSCTDGITRSVNAQTYLKERGLELESLKRVGIQAGYCSEKSMSTWSDHHKAKAREYGLFKKDSNRSRFCNCIVFALKDENGFVSGFYGRHIKIKEGGHFYLSGKHEGLFPAYPKAKKNKIILAESVIDAASLLAIEAIKEQYEVVALYGTNGFTVEHQKILMDGEIEEVILFLDGDEAGEKAAYEYEGLIASINENIKVSVVKSTPEKDANELLIEDPETLQKLLSAEAAKPVKESPTKFISNNPNNLEYLTETAIYSIAGGINLQELSSMKVTLFIANPKELQNILGQMKPIRYRSKLDLFDSKQISQISNAASEKLNLRGDLLERDLNEFTAVLEVYRDQQKEEKNQGSKPKITTDKNLEAKAETFLKKPTLLKELNVLIGKSGVVGEEKSRLCLFIIASTSKMTDTLHALIQGSSGSGKTHLLTKIAALIPNEDVIHLTRVTESSFYNYGENELSNKLICLEDLDGLKEEAFLAFRELQSRGMVSTSTSGKDDNGNIRSYIKVVRGPITSLACTTRGSIYEDNMSRCFIIAVDESKAQTERVINQQNQRAAGCINKEEQEKICEFIQTCVRLIKPLEVVNPYADKIELPKEAHKIRRLNDLFQRFVKQITLLHQYQRKKDKEGKLITEITDIELACEIMFEAIMLKVDELDGSLRHFYEQLKEYVKKQSQGENPSGYSFSQREIRQALHVSKTQLHRYIRNLMSFEYIRLTGGYINKGYHYQITYWDSIEALRAKIKADLNKQINNLKTT